MLCNRHHIDHQNAMRILNTYLFCTNKVFSLKILFWITLFCVVAMSAYVVIPSYIANATPVIMGSGDINITASVPAHPRQRDRLRIPARINFSGRALGYQSVVLTRDGARDRETTVNKTDGSFAISIPSIAVGFYTFTLYAITIDGYRSKPISFSLIIVAETIIDITDIIFILPDSYKRYDCSSVRSDLNCDKRVDMIDFTILLPWYRHLIQPWKPVDINRDGKGDLSDFSIMAYEWTG